jgi:hypothetical protein
MVDAFSNGSLSEASIGSSATSVGDAFPEAASPSPAAIPSHADTPADHSSETPARTNWLNPVVPRGTSTAPLNRDYNFFDALDARLADLQDAEDLIADP